MRSYLFLYIDQTKYDIVSITGNSMGWYTALSLSGSISIKKWLSFDSDHRVHDERKTNRWTDHISIIR